MGFIKKIVRFAAISAGIYLVIAVGLILSQWPAGKVDGDGLHFDRMVLKTPPIEPEFFTLSDNTRMAVRLFEGDGPLVVVVHGSGGHGSGYNWLAEQFAAGGAKVVLPDLRGHGLTEGPRGDVQYIGQMEDDLAELITTYQEDGQEVIMVGHSSGGGLTIRFAGGAHGDMLDGAVLIAPFLKHDAPTSRTDAGGWAQPLVRRFIGLSMLNGVGITAANGMTVMEFNLPEGPLAETMTQAYSFRLNTSYGPRSDYLADVSKLPKFQLIVGRDDEAFLAEAFEPAMTAATDKGTYHILDGVSHLDVFLNEEAAALMVDFVNEF